MSSDRLPPAIPIGSSALRRFSGWLPAILVALSAAGLMMAYVLTYGVNVPYWDEWQLVQIFHKVYLGRMSWWQLILSRQNEHLIGVGYLVSVLQCLLTGFDTRLQLVSGVAMQGLTFALMTRLQWKLLPRERLPLWVAISALVWFSLAQNKNLLWGFQTAWFVVSVLLATTLTLLVRARAALTTDGTDRALFGAAAAAALASFTSLQGVIVWLAGAVYLAGTHAYSLRACLRSRQIRLWLALGALTAVAFLRLWLSQPADVPSGGPFSVHDFLVVFLGIHGAFMGDLGYLGVKIAGVVLLGFVALAARKVTRSPEPATYAVPVAMMVYGIAFVAMVALGRSKFGIGAALDPHYPAYCVMTYAGALTILLHGDGDGDRGAGRAAGGMALAALAFPPVLVVAYFGSAYNAIQKGIEWRADQGAGAYALLHIQDAPDSVVSTLLFGDPGLVRREAGFLASHHMSSYGAADAVPSALAAYTTMPPSMRGLLERYPDQRRTLETLWWGYLSAGDLRKEFDPLAADFCDRLLAWSRAAAIDGRHPVGHALQNEVGALGYLIDAEHARANATAH